MSARNARDLAYHTVRSRIITMELKPGDPLNDRELAEELGISRTPMREALILLNNAHMVAIKPQSGTHVAPIDLHLMELEQFSRYTLEKEILTRMCGRLTPEQEAGYRQLIEAYRVLTMHSTAAPLSCAAWSTILTTCWPACSMWSASASSACRPRRTSRCAPPIQRSWKRCCTAARTM